MSKRIVICADGTWNRPEQDPAKDYPTNVLKLARAIRPNGVDLKPQQVFYDWGIGSYDNRLSGGITGKGLHKNIMDNYRYIVQNFSPGDELYFFGFSRGAYTIRSLCGLINNCGILKRPDASLIQKAFNHYKKSGKAHAPKGRASIDFRRKHAHKSKNIKFVGVWDTVGAMGIPISFLGLFDDKDEFYDTKIGSNIQTARHAMAIDEHRSDFEPTVWTPQQDMDLKQVWFAGSHSDIGGSHKPDTDGAVLSDLSMVWMLKEASKSGLSFEPHIKKSINLKANAKLHNSRRSFYRVKKKYFRPVNHKKSSILVHQSVKERWMLDERYRPENLQEYFQSGNKWESVLVR